MNEAEEFWLQVHGTGPIETKVLTDGMECKRLDPDLKQQTEWECTVPGCWWPSAVWCDGYNAYGAPCDVPLCKDHRYHPRKGEDFDYCEECWQKMRGRYDEEAHAHGLLFDVEPLPVEPERKSTEKYEFDYPTYLASREWGKRRVAVRHRSGGVCERCRSAKAVQVHHLTYKHIGDEPLEDLQDLCGPCHRFCSGTSDFDPVASRLIVLPVLH